MKNIKSLLQIIGVIGAVIVYSVTAYSYLLERFVQKESFSLICERLSRIDDKLDRLIEKHH